GYVIENIDSTVILELPRLRPHINEMRNTIANIMNTSLKNVSVKATTTERLGFAGRKEGIAAEAVVLLKGS
ncbi:MAG: 2-C-methyl-D-erythritol 2,4-cyclodiphosphate synthase, partial [Bacteroidota bacterium]